MLFTKYENYYDARGRKQPCADADSTITILSRKAYGAGDQGLRREKRCDGIVMVVNTGAVLAMATLPDYDLNNYSVLNEEGQGKAYGAKP
jgi:stage V sporulation protein D (sporulation-specific penicillin-binding protein)